MGSLLFRKNSLLITGASRHRSWPTCPSDMHSKAQNVALLFYQVVEEMVRALPEAELRAFGVKGKRRIKLSETLQTSQRPPPD